MLFFIRFRSETDTAQPPKKKSAYSLAPNRVSCPYCHRKFPWSSSLRRHVLTHTGQKPFKCPHCPLLFTTKSNCDRHLLRKHGGSARAILAEPIPDTVSPPQPLNDSRAVPERPFKCSSCPTSTFSSLETLKKHMSSRHGSDSQPGSPNPEIIEEPTEGGLVFKCHLCEASFGDRSGALNHLATGHTAEYEQLVNKGALDAASDRSESADDDERGKFPDHANRKVTTYTIHIQRQQKNVACIYKLYPMNITLKSSFYCYRWSAHSVSVASGLPKTFVDT